MIRRGMALLAGAAVAAGTLSTDATASGAPCRGSYTGPYVFSWVSYSTGGAITTGQLTVTDRNGDGLVCLDYDKLRLQDNKTGNGY